MYKKKTLLYRDTTAAVPAAGTMLVGKYTEDVARFFCRLLDQRTLRHQAKNLPPPRARSTKLTSWPSAVIAGNIPMVAYMNDCTQRAARGLLAGSLSYGDELNGTTAASAFLPALLSHEPR